MFVFIRSGPDEWDVYELYYEDGDMYRTKDPVMCLGGETPSHLGLLISDLKDSFIRGNYFESFEDMESSYE